MFLELFYGLRDEGVPVGTQEWLMLMDALGKGLHGSSLKRFYHTARACLIKHEGHFDAFDRVFARVFHGVEGSLDSITDELLDWLKLLMVEDIPAESLRSKDSKQLIPPLHGALLKNEQDVHLFERLAFMALREQRQ